MSLVVRSLSFAAAMLVLAGCGGDGPVGEQQEVAVEDAAAQRGLDVDLGTDSDDAETFAAARSDATAGRNLNLPAGFPRDVFVSSTWSIMAVSPAPGSGYSIQSMTQDSAEDVLAGVRTEMAAQGWAEMDPENPTGSTLQAGFEKDNRMTAVTVVPSGAANAVQVVTIIKP